MTIPALKSELRLDYRLAPVLGRALLALYALAFLLILTAKFVFPAKLLGLGLVAVHGLWARRGWRRLAEVSALRYEQSGWVVVEAEKELAAKQGRTPLVLGWLVILYLHSGKKRWTIPVTQASTDSDSFRRLKVLLRTA